MNDPKPLVSILLPIKNAEHTITACLDSLLRQTYKNIEIIAIDDKSTDKSLKILRSLRRIDKRIKVFANVKRYGLSMTLNRSLRQAKGQFITIMDAHDYCAARRITKQVRFLEENRQMVAVGAQCTFVNWLDKKVGQSSFPSQNRDIYSSPLHGISVQFETVLINKCKLPKDLLKFSPRSYPFIYSDLLMKVLPYGKFANLEDALYFHRKTPETYFSDLKNNVFSLLRLWLRSVSDYKYSPWSKSFFSPLIKFR
ncbi:glycosyltransferase family 2 protein [Patescibacteria group bacterium]|nr:glycosyltransferase family 2 protein [Patescibacteria group bacterium]